MEVSDRKNTPTRQDPSSKPRHRQNSELFVCIGKHLENCFRCGSRLPAHFVGIEEREPTEEGSERRYLFFVCGEGCRELTVDDICSHGNAAVEWSAQEVRELLDHPERIDRILQFSLANLLNNIATALAGATDE